MTKVWLQNLIDKTSDYLNMLVFDTGQNGYDDGGGNAELFDEEYQVCLLLHFIFLLSLSQASLNSVISLSNNPEKDN